MPWHPLRQRITELSAPATRSKFLPYTSPSYRLAGRGTPLCAGGPRTASDPHTPGEACATRFRTPPCALC